ncbi:MAG TPA: cell division protein SepF [Actinomycetales bacterium]|nr:cell division protein SepF [Actinomycetales bacterium]
MAGALRKTMLYLGLAEDEQQDSDDYRDYEAYEEPEAPVEREQDAQVTPISRAPQRSQTPRNNSAADLRRISTVHPRTYNDAKVIGESFRTGTPVIMNLSDMDDSDAKRLVDFAAGLVFGLHGAIERVTNKVFLLSPAHVQVASEGKEDNAQVGLFNQS